MWLLSSHLPSPSLFPRDVKPLSTHRRPSPVWSLKRTTTATSRCITSTKDNSFLAPPTSNGAPNRASKRRKIGLISAPSLPEDIYRPRAQWLRSPSTGVKPPPDPEYHIHLKQTEIERMKRKWRRSGRMHRLHQRDCWHGRERHGDGGRVGAGCQIASCLERRTCWSWARDIGPARGSCLGSVLGRLSRSPWTYHAARRRTQGVRIGSIGGPCHIEPASRSFR